MSWISARPVDTRLVITSRQKRSNALQARWRSFRKNSSTWSVHTKLEPILTRSLTSSAPQICLELCDGLQVDAHDQAKTFDQAKAVGELRLTNSTSHDPPARELFKSVTVELEPQSVTAFIDICNSAVAVHVHELRLCTSRHFAGPRHDQTHRAWLENYRNLGPAFAKLVNIKSVTVDGNPRRDSSEWRWVGLHIDELVTQIALEAWPRLEHLGIASVYLLDRLESVLRNSSPEINDGLRASMGRISTLRFAHDFMVTRLQQGRDSLRVIKQHMPRLRSLQICDFEMDDEEFRYTNLWDTTLTGKLIALHLEAEVEDWN